MLTKKKTHLKYFEKGPIKMYIMHTSIWRVTLSPPGQGVRTSDIFPTCGAQDAVTFHPVLQSNLP